MERFFILVLIVMLMSCGENVRKNSYSYTDIAEDSISIISNFNKALTEAVDADSLLYFNEQIVKEKPDLTDVYEYGLSRYLIQSGKFEEAEVIANKALYRFANDTLNIATGKYYNLIASIYAYQSDQETAVNYFKKALQVYEIAGDLKQAALIRFNLANVFLARLEYETAYKYSKEASEALKSMKDTLYLPICEALIAITAVQTGKLEEAEESAGIALALSEKYSNVQGLILAYYAFGELAANRKDYPEAIKQLIRSEQLGEQYKQLQPLLITKAALLNGYLNLNNYKQAIKRGEEALLLAQKLKNDDIKYNLFKNLANSYAAEGKGEKAFTYMREAEQLYRDKLNEESQETIHNLLIRYDTEKKNNKILEQEKNLAQNRIWIVLLITGVGIGLLLFIFYKRTNAQKNKMLLKQKESEVLEALSEGEEKERKRLSGELHDGIASYLTIIKMHLESQDQIPHDNQKVLELVQKTHQEIRQVAHNLMPVDFKEISFIKAIENFVKESSTEKCRVSFYSNASSITLSEKKSHILYRAIQEIVQNALKHADATNIDVQVLVQNGNCNVSIEDNGKGFVKTAIKGESGIENLEKRLKKIDADVTIDSRQLEGTSVFVNLKVAS